MAGVRGRRWCFTRNNPEHMGDMPVYAPEWCRFLVFQYERGANGTPHYQGYVEALSTRSRRQMTTWLPGAHFEQAKGTQEENVAYCTKEDGRISGPWSHGEPGQQGKRTDLESAVETMKADGISAVIAEFPALYVRYPQGFKELSNYYLPQRSTQPRVFWMHGPTGSGKSRWCYENGGESQWWSSDTLKWFDGYKQQGVVVIDDFRKDYCTFHFLLRLLDRFPLRVPVKGSFVPFNSSVIFITCPWKPEVLYSNRADEDIGQLLRRIERIISFGPEVPPPRNAAPWDAEVANAWARFNEARVPNN